MTRYYMNPLTGSVDDYDGWWYEIQHVDANDLLQSLTVNAVDLKEVIEVVRDVNEWREL
jgi:hypothetical protein